MALLCTSVATEVRAQDPKPRQPTLGELQAIALLRFAERFNRVEPATPPPTVYRIGLLGNDDTAQAVLKLLPGKTVQRAEVDGKTAGKTDKVEKKVGAKDEAKPAGQADREPPASRVIEIVTYSIDDLRKGSASDCDLLYIANDATQEDRAAAIQAHRKRPTILCASGPGFAAAGGTVQFFVADNKMHFEINAAAAKECGLVPATPLLKNSLKGPRE